MPDADQATLGTWDGAGDAPDRDEAAAVTTGDGAVDAIRDPADARYPDANDSIDVKVTQVDYTVEGNGTEEYPVIHVFGRTPSDDPEHVRVLGMEPYFYVPTTDLDGDPTTAHDVIIDARDSDADDTPFESIRGTPLTKLVARTPRDVGNVRDEFEETYEADILFPNRFLIDCDISDGVTVPERRLDDGTLQVPVTEVQPTTVDAAVRVNCFDIEVDDRRGFPEDGDEPIVCLTSHDSYRNEYIAWLYEPPTGDPAIPDALEEYDRLSTDASLTVSTYDDEAAMLDAFIDYLTETDPDVLSGWNFDDFDAPYLLDRLEELDPDTDYDLDPDRLSRVNEVWRSGWGGPDIKGRVVFDLLYAYQRTQFSELDSYRLDAVGEQELGVGKERYSGDIGDLWEQQPERLLEYNVRDVELCVEIDRNQGVIEFWDEVRSFVGCKLEDAPTPGDAVDMYVLHKASGRFALPTKGQQDGEDFEGGAVFDPITGVRENVTVLDLASLYPNCMVTINASPETKVDEDYDGDTHRAPNDTKFRAEPDGMMREMVDELLAEREQKKDARDDYQPGTDNFEQFDRQQAAVKRVMNCFTPDTEVLTPDGVRSITDLGVGDPVYSFDPESGSMAVKPVLETHAYPDYDGELLDIETSKIDFRVTPNHRMLVRNEDQPGSSWGSDDYRFVAAGDLDPGSNYHLPHDWEGPDPDPIEEVDLTELVADKFEMEADHDVHGHTIAAEVGNDPDEIQQVGRNTTGDVLDADEFRENRAVLEDAGSEFRIHRDQHPKSIPTVYDGDDFLDLLGWYITEGSVYPSEPDQFGENVRGSATTITIAQDGLLAPDGGERSHAAIGSLLDRMGFDYAVDGTCYQFTAGLLGNLFDELCGSTSAEKRIPDLVFDASREQKRRFLEVLIEGDGDWQTNSWRFSTVSERLRDDVLRLCAHLGLNPHYRCDSGVWRIHGSEAGANTVQLNRSGTRSTAEDGVYCVTVADNHSLLAGRNGKFQFVGQSLYGVSGWERFRLYDKESAAAITATGRSVIEFTEEAANELDKEVIYGDSVTGERPIVVRDPTGMVRVIPIRDLFERGAAHPSGPADDSEYPTTVEHPTPPKDRRVVDGWEALSVTDNREPEWRPITAAIRHETDKQVVKLQHPFGESVTTTDHAYVVDAGDGLEEVTPDEVETPLRVSGVPEPETVDEIDVYEVLRGSSRSDRDGRMVGNENAETKGQRIHADDEWVWFGQSPRDSQTKTVKVKRHIDLENDDGGALLRLLAAYITEGRVSTEETSASKFGASISESDRDWLEQLQEDYHRLFQGATTSVIECDRTDERAVVDGPVAGSATVAHADQTVEVRMMNELSAVFFREFAGQSSRGKRIPSFVYHLDEDLQSEFLTTLVKADGARKFRRGSDEDSERHIDFETTSQAVAAGLSVLLIQRGHRYSMEYREAKSSYTIRTGDQYRSGRDPVLQEVAHDGYVYDLSVDGNQNFVDAVGGIVLHNTDSVMLELGEDIGVDDAIESSFEIEDHINSRYDEFAREALNADEHRFEIEFEKLYRRFFQAGKKKRYAGHIVWKEGAEVDDVDITGFEYKRSDIAPVTKRVQREVIERVVHGEDVDAVAEYVHEVIEDYRDGAVDIDDVGIPGGIGKRLNNYDTDTAHVRGAKYANLLLGTNFQRGSKPKRLYLEKVHPSYFREVEAERPELTEDPLYIEFKRDPDVICFEFADQIPAAFEVDWEKMLAKTLQGPIERVLAALDVSWEEVQAGQTQTGLGSFM